MTRQEILDQVRAVLAEELGTPPGVAVGLETDLVADLCLDSLGLLTLAVALENRFAVLLDEDPSESPTRVSAVVDGIASALALREIDAA